MAAIGIAILLFFIAAPDCVAQIHGTTTSKYRQDSFGNIEFRLLETEHFAIQYTVSVAEAEEAASWLEETYVDIMVFCRHFHLPGNPSHEKLRVFFVSSDDEFAATCSHLQINTIVTGAMYDIEKNVSVFSALRGKPTVVEMDKQIERMQWRLNHPDDKSMRNEQSLRAFRDSLRELKKRRNELVHKFTALMLRHEAAHHVLYNTGVLSRSVDYPPWLIEGLACLFEVSTNQNGQALPGRTPVARRDVVALNIHRLADLKNAIAAKKRERINPDATFRNRSLPPLSDLVNQPGCFQPANSRAALHYAQAWGLLYYLCTERPLMISRVIDEHTKKSRSETPSPAENEVALDFLDAEFEAHWLRFIQKLRLDRSEEGR